MTVDPRVLLDQRTEAITRRIEDLEAALGRLNLMMCDLLGEFQDNHGPLPERFGQKHSPRDDYRRHAKPQVTDAI